MELVTPIGFAISNCRSFTVRGIPLSLSIGSISVKLGPFMPIDAG